MAELKAGPDWYTLTDPVAAQEFDPSDYYRDLRKVTLPAGTIFRVTADAGEVNGERVNAITANGKAYRIDSEN